MRLVIRDFPLDIHDNARKAAEAANAAYAQGKFFEYIELLFKNQKALDVPSLSVTSIPPSTRWSPGSKRTGFIRAPSLRLARRSRDRHVTEPGSGRGGRPNAVASTRRARREQRQYGDRK